MTTASHPQEPTTHSAMHHHRVQDGSLGCSSSATEPLHARPLHVPILLAACVSAASFVAGIWVGGSRLEARVREAADVRMLEFVLFADRIGALDRKRLEEAIITAAEAVWEDAEWEDAEERSHGGGR